MALDQYTEILETVSDPRVGDWPLMDSPIPTFLIVVSYIYFVTLLGPRLMTNRKPFQLRGTLVAYNAFQVIFSLGMMYETFKCLVADAVQTQRDVLRIFESNKNSTLAESGTREFHPTLTDSVEGPNYIFPGADPSFFEASAKPTGERRTDSLRATTECLCMPTGCNNIHLMSGWLLEYSYKCQPVDYSHNPSALRMANLCWWYFISKFTEFADTVFFVLRKKESQVTFLHLYHHSLTPLETWICVKFIAGGHGTLGNLINNGVHVMMYAYYMLSAMGPEYQKYVWWKKHLTTVQLVQFFLVFVHSAQALVFDCGYPKLIAALLLLHSVIFFALFSDFYQRAYRRARARKMLTQEKTLKSD